MPKDLMKHFAKDSVVAVTGGAGLIGSFLVDELVSASFRVVVIDDFSKGQRRNLSHVIERIEVREGNLEKQDFANEALAGCHIIFHLASRAFGIGYSDGRHIEILQHNERITDSVLNAVAHHRPKHLMVTSSSCVYPDDGPETVCELPLFQGEPEMVNWGYGWAKRFLEQKSLIYSRETGVPVTVVRPFNIYGERYRWVGEFSQAIPMLVKRVMDGENPVVIWGSGNQRRSYIHARDCARMMLALVQAGHTQGPVNIGTEETVSISDLVNLICQIAGVSPTLAFDRSKPEGRRVKSADMRLFRAVVPDFTFSHDLGQGLAAMIGWYADLFGKDTACGSKI